MSFWNKKSKQTTTTPETTSQPTEKKTEPVLQFNLFYKDGKQLHWRDSSKELEKCLAIINKALIAKKKWVYVPDKGFLIRADLIELVYITNKVES